MEIHLQWELITMLALILIKTVLYGTSIKT
jgi:hypothetical protein